jgi:hypothetical protein
MAPRRVGAISRRDQGGTRGILSQPSAEAAFGRSQTLKGGCEKIGMSPPPCHSERSEESRSALTIGTGCEPGRDSSLRSE